MDDRAFARYLGAWLDPSSLMEAADAYETSVEDATRRDRLVLPSRRLISGDDGHYALLVRKYLRGFFIPHELIMLLRACTQVEMSDSTWSWLLDLKCADEIEVFSRGNVPTGLHPETILVVAERTALLDIVSGPLLALKDMVVSAASAWRPLARTGATIYYESKAPSEFYSYVEERVAGAFVTLSPPVHDGVTAVKNRYRAVTVCGDLRPAGDVIWEVAQEVARIAAASTHDPIPER